MPSVAVTSTDTVFVHAAGGTTYDGPVAPATGDPSRRHWYGGVVVARGSGMGVAAGGMVLLAAVLLDTPIVCRSSWRCCAGVS